MAKPDLSALAPSVLAVLKLTQKTGDVSLNALAVGQQARLCLAARTAEKLGYLRRKESVKGRIAFNITEAGFRALHRGLAKEAKVNPTR